VGGGDADSISIISKRPGFDDRACGAVTCPLGDGGGAIFDVSDITLVQLLSAGFQYKTLILIIEYHK
jgi:hypothetical protein